MDEMMVALLESTLNNPEPYWLKSFVEGSEGSLVLNPGSGVGSPITEQFFRRGARVISLDYSLRDLRGNPHTKIQGNALYLPFESDTFDFVTSESLILSGLRSGEFADDSKISGFIEEVKRVLKPRGHYIGHELQYGVPHLEAQGFVEVEKHQTFFVTARNPE